MYEIDKVKIIAKSYENLIFIRRIIILLLTFFCVEAYAGHLENVLAQRAFSLNEVEIDNPGAVTNKYLAVPYDLFGLEAHAGIDLRAKPAGKHVVYGISDGQVIQADNAKGTLGVYDDKYDYTVFYLHLNDIYANYGDAVYVNDKLALAGDKGTESPHLHIEVRRGRHERALGGRVCNDRYCYKDEIKNRTLNPVAPILLTKLEGWRKVYSTLLEPLPISTLVEWLGRESMLNKTHRMHLDALAFQSMSVKSYVLSKRCVLANEIELGEKYREKSVTYHRIANILNQGAIELYTDVIDIAAEEVKIEASLAAIGVITGELGTAGLIGYKSLDYWASYQLDVSIEGSEEAVYRLVRKAIADVLSDLALDKAFISKNVEITVNEKLKDIWGKSGLYQALLKKIGSDKLQTKIMKRFMQIGGNTLVKITEKDAKIVIGKVINTMKRNFELDQKTDTNDGRYKVEQMSEPLCQVTRREEKELYENGTALILDRSGSMKEIEYSHDGTSAIKIDRAKQAMNAYITDMPDSDNVSIATFSDKGETPLPMSKVSIVRDVLNQTLSKILPSGRTNIGDGLSKGLKELEKTGGDQQMTILLSDGKSNVGEWKSVVEQYKQKGWPICTLGFGKDADEVTLTKIAGDTGCVYKYAETLDLINSFQELSAYAQNKSIILTVRDLLLSRKILDYKFHVEKNADSFNVYTSWQGSKLSTKLIGPNGSRFSDADVRSNSGRYEAGKTFQMLEVKDPAPGAWHVEVSWTEAPPIPEQVNISIAEKSDVFAWLNGFRPKYSVNETVTINVNAANVVNNKKVPLMGGTVIAEIIKPGPDVIRMVQAQSTQWTMFKDVLQNNTRKVTLYDDGKHNDYKAEDGIFGGIFRETDKSGAYLVNATIHGQKQNGDPVEKLITGSFQVGPITNNSVTSSQSLRYTKEARRHFSQPNPTPEQLERAEPTDDIEQLENSSDPLESIDQLNDEDPLDSIDSLMKSGG